MPRTYTFTRNSVVPHPVEEVFAWHERPGALERLLPPWQGVEVLEQTGGLREGARVVLRMRLAPLLHATWVARHTDYDPPRRFRDLAERGPFRSWDHTHRFDPTPDGHCSMTDEIRFQLPGGALGGALASGHIERELARGFAYRHRIVARDLRRHAEARAAGFAPGQRVWITGASGLVGSSLAAMLSSGGHSVTRLVRSAAASPGAGSELLRTPTVTWPEFGPAAAEFPPPDVVVHLAGENVAARRWSESQKRRLIDSRVGPTRRLCEALARLPKPPHTLIAASAIGYYGDRGEETLPESAPQGRGFLADLCRAWEEATSPAREAGIRVVTLRIGVVLTPRGGALAKMLPAFQAGLGGKLGSGRQWMSWISLDDLLGLILFAAANRGVVGPVNAVAPGAVTNAEFTAALARALGRWTGPPVPATALRMAVGALADEALLASARVAPQAAHSAGFRFDDPGLEGAFAHLFGQ